MFPPPALTFSTPSAPRVLAWLSALDLERFFPGCDRLDGLIVDAAAADAVETLRTINPEVVVTGWQTPALPLAWLDAKSCGLRYVCHLGGTVRRFVPRTFLERGGWVTNWGGAAADSVAEQAVLLALAALRDLPAWPQWGGARRGEPAPPATRTLRGKRVGLHGFGGVAQALARLLRPFGVELAAYSEGVPAAVFSGQGIRQAQSLEELLRGSDVFIECEALTPATAGCLDAARLALLPAGAVFVNVGRGRLVDEAALLAAAESGRLRVAVDVLANEPITATAALCQAAGVVVSPHIGGPTREEYAAIGRAALENIERYRRGEPLAQVVTLELYDRST